MRCLHAVHVFVAADLVVFLEADLDESGVRARSCWCRSRRNRAWCRCWRRSCRRSSGRDDLADQVFHLRDFVFGDVEARAGGRFEIDDELARRRCGEKGEAEQREERQAGDEEPSRMR